MFWGAVDAVVNAADVWDTYCKACGSFQEQSPCGFYWRGCKNI